MNLKSLINGLKIWRKIMEAEIGIIIFCVGWWLYELIDIVKGNI